MLGAWPTWRPERQSNTAAPCLAHKNILKSAPRTFIEAGTICPAVRDHQRVRCPSSGLRGRFGRRGGAGGLLSRRSRPRLVSLLPGAVALLRPQTSSDRRCNGKASWGAVRHRRSGVLHPGDRSSVERLLVPHRLWQSCRCRAGPRGARGAARHDRLRPRLGFPARGAPFPAGYRFSLRGPDDF
ncbi:hypothetical protein NDU88_001938 [Pleurodeles waltl]|uniref:Uncharacterized protein n=1 Tax=Pleurodeles waltl TaxID=8319 RepID=A0AAV7UVI3_PLEWA|nr:hypothetical protein NDU88_001938 [Pleurodeles waltl]